MPTGRLRLPLLLMLVAAATTRLAAAAGSPGGHLGITEVHVDKAAETLLILGHDFGPAGRLRVELGEIGDITPLCSAQLTATPQRISCDFSGSGLPADGDYLLLVATGNGQSQSDEYALTIGGAAAAPPALTFYTRSATALAVDGVNVEVVTATAVCDPGDTVVGGGFTNDVHTGPHSMPQDIESAPNASGTGWVASIERTMPVGSTVTAWARCADVTP